MSASIPSNIGLRIDFASEPFEVDEITYVAPWLDESGEHNGVSHSQPMFGLSDIGTESTYLHGEFNGRPGDEDRLNRWLKSEGETLEAVYL